MPTVLFHPRNFVVADVLLESITFNAAYFVAQIMTQLHESHSISTESKARWKLRLHCGNSVCHIAGVVSDEMTRL
jgi:hypothetical protein